MVFLSPIIFFSDFLYYNIEYNKGIRYANSSFSKFTRK